MKFLHSTHAEYSGQEFVVGDVLEHGADNFPGFLVESVSVPGRVDLMELLLNMVVFTCPCGVHGDQASLLIRSRITWWQERKLTRLKKI